MGKSQVGSESQRAEHLDKVRDIIVLGVTKNILRRSELGNLAVHEKILVRRDGQPFDYTSIYRYLDVLHYLGFDQSKQYDYQGLIEWDQRALYLTEIGSINYRSQRLSEPEKELLRGAIFESNANMQFLSYFWTPNRGFQSPQEFRDKGSSIYVIEETVKKPQGLPKEGWPAEASVRINLQPTYDGSILRPKQEFLYTYRYWCLDTGIIDEIHIHEAERYKIPKIQSYVLYPIDPNINVSVNQFMDLLYSSVGYNSIHPRVFPIPWLMYKICPVAKLNIETFKTLLIETSKQKRHVLHLERGPGGLIKGIQNAYQSNYSDRYGNHRYYIILEGTIRTNLILFPSDSKE